MYKCEKCFKEFYFFFRKYKIQIERLDKEVKTFTLSKEQYLLTKSKL